MTTVTFDKSYDTNGGANRFFLKDGALYVSGQSVAGAYKLSGADNSSFLAKLWGGTLLSNGNVGAADGRTPDLNDPTKVKIATSGDADIGKTFDTWSGNLNVQNGATASTNDPKIAATLDLGSQFVGGKEKYGFDSAQDAVNFLQFLKDLKLAGINIGDIL